MVRAARNGLCRSMTRTSMPRSRASSCKRAGAERDEHHIVIAVESGYGIHNLGLGAAYIAAAHYMHDSQSQIPPLDKYNQYTMKTGDCKTVRQENAAFFGDFSANEVCVSTAFMVYLRQHRTTGEAAAPCAGSGRAAAALAQAPVAAAALYGNFCAFVQLCGLAYLSDGKRGFFFLSSKKYHDARCDAVPAGQGGRGTARHRCSCYSHIFVEGAVSAFNLTNTTIQLLYLILAGWMANSATRYVGEEYRADEGRGLFSTVSTIYVGLCVLVAIGCCITAAVTQSPVYLGGALMFLHLHTAFQVLNAALIQLGRVKSIHPVVADLGGAQARCCVRARRRQVELPRRRSRPSLPTLLRTALRPSARCLRSACRLLCG